MNKKGNVLIVIFIILSILYLLGLSFNYLVSTDISIAQNKEYRLVAEKFAKSGAYFALQNIIDLPILKVDYADIYSGATISVSSVSNGYDPRDVIGGKYSNSKPGTFKFDYGDSSQWITINFNTIRKIWYITSYQVPDTLGETFKVETSKDGSSYTLWCDIANPKGSLLQAKYDGGIDAQYIRITYGKQNENIPVEILEIFAKPYKSEFYEKSFCVNMGNFTDSGYKIFIKYKIKGMFIFSTARIMKKVFLWETLNLVSYKLEYVIEYGDVKIINKYYVNNHISIDNAQEIENATELSRLLN